MPNLKVARDFLKKILFLWNLLRFVKHRIFLPLVQHSTLNVPEAFPVCAPTGEGGYAPRAKLTIRGINQLLPGLYSLVMLNGHEGIKPCEAGDWPFPDGKAETALELGACLEKFGTGKGPVYLKLYGHILQDRARIQTVLEFGLGSNDRRIVANCQGTVTPGATLRALRQFLGRAQIYGADLDTEILFTDERIQTYFVDQTVPASLEALGRKLPLDFDLIIDDGLHAPVADLPTLNFSLSRLRVGGWLVVEDIPRRALIFWKVVATILAESFGAILIANGDDTFIFAVERKHGLLES